MLTGRFDTIFENVMSGGMDRFEHRGFKVSVSTDMEGDNAKRVYVITAPGSTETVEADINPYMDPYVGRRVAKLFVDAWIAAGQPPRRSGAGPISVGQLSDIIHNAKNVGDANVTVHRYIGPKAAKVLKDVATHDVDTDTSHTVTVPRSDRMPAITGRGRILTGKLGIDYDFRIGTVKFNADDIESVTVQTNRLTDRQTATVSLKK